LSHQWGALTVVVACGELDAVGGSRLERYGRRLAPADVILELWDVSECDGAGIASVRRFKSRVEATGWGFALVADPGGPCADALSAHGLADEISTCTDRRRARAALSGSPANL
jgi:hypothetical protein